MSHLKQIRSYHLPIKSSPELRLWYSTISPLERMYGEYFVIYGMKWFNLYSTEHPSDSCLVAGTVWTPSKSACFQRFSYNKYSGLIALGALPSGLASWEPTLPMWRTSQPACAVKQRWKSWHCMMNRPHLWGWPYASPRLWFYELAKGRCGEIIFSSCFLFSWSLRWLYQWCCPWHPRSFQTLASTECLE